MCLSNIKYGMGGNAIHWEPLPPSAWGAPSGVSSGVRQLISQEAALSQWKIGIWQIRKQNFSFLSWENSNMSSTQTPEFTCEVKLRPLWEDNFLGGSFTMERLSQLSLPGEPKSRVTLLESREPDSSSATLDLYPMLLTTMPASSW